MSARLATVTVFVTSFCVLVLEILAGRLLAPVIGVSLESFTGIIGTVLAGIAAGNTFGGRLADAQPPRALIGPAIMAGGASSWLAPPITSAIATGAHLSPDPGTIVFLTVLTFFLPALILSSVTPMVAKLRLSDVGETGRVVGNLSAAGTFGALAGTFLTGFVLVAAFPTRRLIFLVGLGLVLFGAGLSGWSRLKPQAVGLGLVALLGLASVFIPSPCDAETAYACVEIEADDDRPQGLGIVLNGSRNSYVDLDDPTYLEFRYMRLFADVVAPRADSAAVDVLHLGGAGFTFPRYINAVRAGANSQVLEIDAELVDYAEEELALEQSDRLRVRTGDARLTIAAEADGSYDVIVGDAFSGLTIPWHLTTTEFVAELDRVLRPDGIVVANLIDGEDLGFARAELATYKAHFNHVALIRPQVQPDSDWPDSVARNLMLIASDVPLPLIEVDPQDGILLDEADTTALIDDAEVLTDDFAPVDQLRHT